MEELIQATIAGLAVAAILAVAASGLVLTYTTTGVFNFAHGALGMLGAFAYWQLRFDWGWPAPLALLVVLGVLAPLVGVLIERVIMRGLADAPESARVVVTISLLVALLGVGWVVWRTDEARRMPRFWGNTASWDIAGVAVTYHAVVAFGVAVALAVGLRLLLFSTRSGVTMRAAVDNRNLSALNGARSGRSAMLAWAVGTVCAALSGVLMAPLTGLRHIDLTLLIVNAYAAAIIGRLRSLPLTFLGALGLGLADSYLLEFAPDDSAVWGQFRNALPAVTLLVVLLVLRPPALARSHTMARVREIVPRPGWSGSLITAATIVAGSVYLSATFDSTVDLLRLSQILALAVIALSLVPLVGYGGQLSLCQMSFAGIGAVAAANWGAEGSLAGLGYAALLAGAVGALVALPAIRLGGLYFALATAAFAVLLDRWLFRLDELVIGGHRFELFPAGQTNVSRLTLPVYGDLSPNGLLITMGVVFALFYLLVVTVRRRTFGQRLLAMKTSPAAAATVGMSLTRTKFAVFTLSAAMAGIGGALFTGSTQGAVQPDEFGLVASLPLVLLAVVGGITSASGALFAGIMIGGIPLLLDAWPWFENLSLVLPGLMGIMLGRNPNGATAEMREGFAPLRQHRPALVLTLSALTVVFALRLFDVVGGYSYLLALLVAGLSGSLLVRLLELRGGSALPATAAGTTTAAGTSGRDGDVGADGRPVEEVAWERVGIERPFTPEDAVALEQAIGVDLGRPRLRHAESRHAENLEVTP